MVVYGLICLQRVAICCSLLASPSALNNSQRSGLSFMFNFSSHSESELQLMKKLCYMEGTGYIASSSHSANIYLYNSPALYENSYCRKFSVHVISPHIFNLKNFAFFSVICQHILPFAVSSTYFVLHFSSVQSYYWVGEDGMLAM